MTTLRTSLASMFALTLSMGLACDSKAERSTAQCPEENPVCRSRFTATNPILATILSIQPKSAVLFFNKSSTPIQFQYFDPSSRTWKKQTAEMTGVTILVCSACQNTVKIFFHDSVENQQAEARLGSFNIFMRSEDNARWHLLTP